MSAVPRERRERDEARDALVPPDQPGAVLADRIAAIPLARQAPPAWLLGFMAAFALLMVFFVAVTWLLARGVGVWGIDIPVGWGFAIVNFVWWIGIGHAGTFISAILLVAHQEWRTSINRFTEAMTLFAVACAGMFPLLHLGRPWRFYFMIPYPDTMALWPQFRSALVWDLFAVLTYATISLVFWYVGLVPDLASMRDRTTGVRQKLYGVAALGWRGSAAHWARYEKLYTLLAGLATPLVISVHSVVSFDFAIAIVPGWHSTIFPPYFVAGAIFSGFAMVLTLVIPIRAYYGLRDMITPRHLDNMAKVTLAMGLVVAYGYLQEAFMAFYGADTFDQYVQLNRFGGVYAPIYWITIACNVLVPQVLWSARARRSPLLLFAVSLLINVGMWSERFVIVVTSLQRDYLPSSWGLFVPTLWDYATFAGTIGLFLSALFLFVRVLPAIAMSEMTGLSVRSRREEP